MSDKDQTQNTPETQPTKEPEQDWQKRYKDLQATYTKETQKSKELAGKLEELELTLNQIAPFVDMDRLQGKGQETDSIDENAPVTKKDIENLKKQMQEQQQRVTLMSKFERENPDLVEYQDLVGFYLQNRTDGRMSLERRMDKAVEMARTFLDTERQKGASQTEQDARERQRKQAEASGLETSPPAEERETPEPTYNDYMAEFKALQVKRQGY